MYTIDPSVLDTPQWQSKVVYVDFETQSAVDLRKVGSIKYINHPTTRIMSAVFMNAADVIVYVNPLACPFADKIPLPAGCKLQQTLPLGMLKGKTLVGHNAEMFDALLFDVAVPGYSFTWIDTIHLCRAAGLPAGLDMALQAIGRDGKLSSGAMMILSQARVTGRGQTIYPVGTIPLWQKMIAYNIKDVTELEVLLKYLQPLKREPEVIRVQSEINQTGFMIDREYAKHLRGLWQEMQTKAKDEVEVITGGALKYHPETGKHDIGSPQKVKAYLTGLGFTLPGDSLNQQTVNQILAHPERYIDGMDDSTGEGIIALLATRQNACRATVGKLDRILEDSGETGLVTHWSNYYGAHTGRNSGRGINPLNFPRGVELQDLDKLLKRRNSLTYEDVVQSSVTNSKSLSDVLGSLTRSVIVPRKGNKFVICDYMQIEARVLAWLSGCDKLLNAFRNPKIDVYCQMASMLFGRSITKHDKIERFIGKTTVLGSGYGMGKTKFEIMAKVYNLDLAGVGISAQECINAYRKGYPEVPKLWKATNIAATNAVTAPGYEFHACKSVFKVSEGFLEILIPSGRTLRYRNPRIVKAYAPWGELVDNIEYQTGYGFYKKLYGGILVENIDQSLSRDIMVCMMVKDVEHATPVLHVYDEIVWEIESKRAETTLQAIGEQMSKPPEWGRGIPLGVEGHTSNVYAKSGKKQATYLDGVRIGG